MDDEIIQVNSPPESEETILATIYKKDGRIGIKWNQDDSKLYEVYGFLRIYVELFHEELLDQMEADKEKI